MTEEYVALWGLYRVSDGALMTETTDEALIARYLDWGLPGGNCRVDFHGYVVTYRCEGVHCE